MSELLFRPATELGRLVRAKELNPEDLVIACLERIAQVDPELNAFVTISADEALTQAREAKEAVERGGDLPPFHGVPIPIKDLTETMGIRTTYSTKIAERYVPTFDAHVVEHIKRAGFIIVGKTNTPELGTIPMTESDLNGICRNPWDEGRTPGGSSGGAAAAVASGMVPLAHGSDGGGSVRIPASCCGIFGIKPSRGRISSGPRIGESAAGLSTSGALARSVLDAAALLDVMSGYEIGDPYWAPPPERPFVEEVGEDPGRLRIGFTTTSPTNVPVDHDCVAAVEDAAKLLAGLGHEVFEIASGIDAEELLPHFFVVWQTLSAGAGVDDPSVFEPVNEALARTAAETSSLDYVRGVIALHAMSRRVVAMWNDADVIVSPVLNKPPVPVGWIRDAAPTDGWAQFLKAAEWVTFTPIANMTGQPSVSVPLYWNEGGLPVGTMLTGRPADEATLIRLSSQLEQARPWADKIPPAYAT